MRDPYEPDGRDHVCKNCHRWFESAGKLNDHVVCTHESGTVEILT